MKIRHVTLTVLGIMLIFASCASAQKFDASHFSAWVGEEGLWRSVVPKAFKTGAQNAPTDAQLKDIMSLVTKTPTSGGSNDFFVLVVKDPAKQQDVVGQGNASDGTVMLMVFTDRVLEKNPRNVPFSPDRGYVTAGFVGGYINLAAISKGFGTHFFESPSGYYGNRPWIPAYNATNTKPAIEDVYLKDKGYQYFIDGDYIGNPTGNPNGAYFDPYGNLKFVFAVIIGTLDTTADSSATTKKYPANWAFEK